MLASLCMFSFFLITPLCNMMFVGQLSLMTGRSVAKCRAKENEVINSQASHSIFELIGSCSCNHLKCVFLHKTRQHSLFYFSSRNKEAWVVGDLVAALWWKCLVGNGEPLLLHWSAVAVWPELWVWSVAGCVLCFAFSFSQLCTSVHWNKQLMVEDVLG